jgi:hypothetical protein
MRPAPVAREGAVVQVDGRTIFRAVRYGDGYAWCWTGENARRPKAKRSGPSIAKAVPR